jgi:hypothetical protein
MRSAFLAVLMALATSHAFAQTQDPVGPFVIDARGLMAGLPTQEGWVPTLPVDTVVPSRGFGLEGGAHLYSVRLGPARLGVGAALTFARGTATATVEGTPDVVTTSTTFAPQLSFNFGHRLGWSYLSAGYGAAKIVSESSSIATVPGITNDSGWRGALNVGGGARWFISEHVGVGFEARWHLLSSLEATTTHAGAGRATLFHLAVGLSIH